jgi:transposase
LTLLKTKADDFLPADLDFNYSYNPHITSINRIQQRAQIIVLNQIGITKQMISWFVNRDLSTINRWTGRFLEAEELNDQKRSGHPLHFMEDVQLKTISFYCQANPLPGLSHFSLRDAAKYLDQHKEILGYTVSYSTIYRFLKSHSLRPHLNKYFLSITDPDFFPKMQHIVDLYLNQPEYLFSYDECPGIQALM